MKPSIASLLLLIVFLDPMPLLSADESRSGWTMDESYYGPHQSAFNKLRHEVPILLRQTMIDLAVRCGLNFEDGWAFPFTIRFDDTAPYGTENVLAYVQIEQNEKGELRQKLVVNLAAYDRENFNFNKVFAHELVHAMLNDSLGEASTRLPLWFHEGLAVYGSDQGEQLNRSYVERFSGAQVSGGINGLEGPHGPLDYLEDYLAFKYVFERHGVNSLHNLIREVIKRKGDVKGAIDYTCLENWEEFQENARAFAEEEVARMARSLRGERATRPF